MQGAGHQISSPSPGVALESKKLARFFSEDKPPRKRLATALEFLKTSGPDQQDLFWRDVVNGSTFFSVLHAYLTELETMYVVMDKASVINKLRNRKFQTEDWTDVFEGLEILIKSNKSLLASGWQHNRFLTIFQKLLLADNMPFIKKYAFRCLALYADILMDADFDMRNTATLLDSTSTENVQLGFGFSHLDLLAESIDFSPYASGNANVYLPPRHYTEGAVVGWERPGPTQAEEPVDMLKYVMDLSLERSDNIKDVDVQRFMFWCNVLMGSFMPLLYPKVCIEVGFKEKTDKLGFFHHCPGSFQRVMARWLYKLRSKQKFMDALWSRKDYVDVVMETLRQRFAYRDPELIVDGIKFYAQLCKGTQYMPPVMKANLHELHRSMIGHVSQVFHPGAQFDDSNIFLIGIELMELLSQQRLHVHSFAVLRKAVLATTDASYCLRDNPPGQVVLTPMVSTVFHTWIHGLAQPNGASVEVWAELATMVKKWLLNPTTSVAFGLELIRRWKLELLTLSHVLQLYLAAAVDKEEMGREFSSFLIHDVAVDADRSVVVVDRLLHVLSPSTIASLRPQLSQAVQDAVLEVVKFWSDKPHLASPSTIVALFGEWFLPACDLTSSEMEKTRCVTLETACTILTQRAAASLIPAHAATLAQILLSALQDDSRTNVVSTVLHHGAELFTRSIPGVIVLVPAFLRTIDTMIGSVGALHRNLLAGGDKSNGTRRMPRFGNEMKRNMISSMEILFALLPLPAQLPELPDLSIASHLETLPDDVHIPAMDAELHDVAGRCFTRILEFTFPDVTDVQQRALWGLYVLIVVQLNTAPSPLVKQYVVLLCDTCASSDAGLALTALSVVHALHRFHASLLAYEPALVQHIVMALSLLVQQQVEDASNVVREILETAPVEPTSPMASLTHSTSESSVHAQGGRKRSNSWSGSVRGLEKPTADSTSLKAAENPVLKTIVAKTTAVFETLSDWVIECDTILHDPAVLKLLFDALEAALIGSIPDGAWQLQVEQQRTVEHKMDMPLLFLGLAMRASLDGDRHKPSLQCFSDIAMAAEGFLMHLMHHLHGFPSPAGVDQLVSSCTEFPDEPETLPPNALSFIYMNSIVLTVVGSVDAATARIVARDMTGTYTWDATMPLASSLPMPSLPTGDTDVESAMDEPWTKHLPPRASPDRERLEVVMDHALVLATQPSSDVCPLCGGRLLEKPPQPSAEKVTQMAPFPVLRKTVPKGNTLPSMPQYVFHDETHGSSNGLHDTYVCKCDPDELQAKSTLPTQVSDATSICNLFCLPEAAKSSVGGLDHERSLLDLLVDSIPMHFRDCGGDLIDKTLLGGRFTMQKYLDMEWDDMYTTDGGPLQRDATDVPGFSFVQRLLHDEECYAYLKTFLQKEEKGKELIEFCDGVKKYERSFEGNDRVSQATLLYWEFFSPESVSFTAFPFQIASKLQHALQAAQATTDATPLPLTLFQDAMDYVEDTCFLGEGRLDRFVSMLNDAHAKSLHPPADGNWNAFVVPPQLALYDAFSVMELNVRICAETLEVKKSNTLLQPALPSSTIALPTASKMRISPLDVCRLWLAQLGILPNESTVGQNHVLILENGVKLERSLKHLDKTPSRETIKIGIVYVGKHQSQQHEILGNTHGSAEYEEFLLELGWPITLATHKGFTGGLDHNPKSLSNGPSTIYYANSTTEVVFHVVTKMPTKANDPQQIDKKRHVGNDHVHIVWSDNPQAYTQSTITSNFNFVQIVVFPLRQTSEGLFLINVLTKPDVPLFGPLMDGMVVTRRDLPELLRQTVMNANRACRQQSAWYLPPYPTRRKLIDEIVERYATDYSEKSMLTSLFKIPSPAEGHSI